MQIITVFWYENGRPVSRSFRTDETLEQTALDTLLRRLRREACFYQLHKGAFSEVLRKEELVAS